MKTSKLRGVVKWFREDGTGYITSVESPDRPIFLHESEVIRGKRNLYRWESGARVSFTKRTILGKDVAVNVIVLPPRF